MRVAAHQINFGEAWGPVPPLRVAFAADFHAGPTTDPELLRRSCEALRSLDAGLLLLGGDYISLRTEEIEWLAPLLGAIPAPLGRFAVLGNHDHLGGATAITRALEKAGIEVLTNRNLRLPAPYERVWLCGIDDFLSGVPDAGRALEGAEGLRIVLMHGPANLLDLAGARFDLALCGHTHGGQLAWPTGRPITAAPGPLTRRYNRGRFELSSGTLLVTVGLGCSTLPFRLNAPPEVLAIDIGSGRLGSGPVEPE